MKSGFFWDMMPCSLLKVRWCSSKLSVDFQRTTWPYTPGDRTLHIHHCNSLQSYIIIHKLQNICYISLKTTENTIWYSSCYSLFFNLVFWFHWLRWKLEDVESSLTIVPLPRTLYCYLFNIYKIRQRTWM
jgi:hypothetical protein